MRAYVYIAWQKILWTLLNIVQSMEAVGGDPQGTVFSFAYSKFHAAWFAA
jgi:hypothetical protein